MKRAFCQEQVFTDLFLSLIKKKKKKGEPTSVVGHTHMIGARAWGSVLCNSHVKNWWGTIYIFCFFNQMNMTGGHDIGTLKLSKKQGLIWWEVKSYNLSIVMFRKLFCLEIIKLTIWCQKGNYMWMTMAPRPNHCNTLVANPWAPF